MKTWLRNRTRAAYRALFHILGAAGALLALCTGTSYADARPGLQAPLPLMVQFFAQSPEGIELAALIRGAPGSGYLLFYDESATPQQARLMVHFYKGHDSSAAVAEVYDTPPGEAQIPISLQDGKVRFITQLEPKIILTNPAGWWARDGKPNYNLEIQIQGAVHALWGADQGQKNETPGWLGEIQPGEPAVQIQVGDTDSDGLPDWELRRLIPEFPGKGYIRASYAERKCPAPTQIDPGAFPAWPYLATSAAFEQPPGQFHPPIGVDWSSGQVTHFAELVSVRNQNCSYALYSLDALLPGQLNRASFEAPFAFYDLSEVGVGYPNLVLRSEHFPAASRWMPLLNREFTTVRYSWREAPGDWLWDYKIEVFGFHPYRFHTPLAGGATWVDTPSYEAFPGWVVKQAWPAITFIDTEGKSYRSSEGIYDWSPLALGQPFLQGFRNEPEADAFLTIRSGLRGEYQLSRARQPELYFSPIDNRLHLLGAEGGLWSLDEQTTLLELNSDQDDYLDGWLRLRQQAGMATCVDQEALANCQVEEALFAPGDYLIYTAGERLILRKSSYSASLFSILPPTDRQTWSAFIADVDGFTANRRDGLDLLSWLDGFPGETLEVQGATLSEMELQPGGFHFVLLLSPDHAVAASGENPLQGLGAGRYLVEYASGKLQVRGFRPAQIELSQAGLTFLPATPLAGQPVQVSGTVRNTGDGRAALAAGLWAALPDQSAQLVQETALVLPGGQAEKIQFLWIPEAPGMYYLELRLQGDDLRQAAGLAKIMVQPAGAADLGGAWQLSQPAAPWLAVLLLAGSALGAAALALDIFRGGHHPG